MQISLINRLTAAIFIAKIGKPPDISQTDGDTYARKQEVEFIVPTAAFGIFLSIAHLGHFTLRRGYCHLWYSAGRLASFVRPHRFGLELYEGLIGVDLIFLLAPVIHFLRHGACNVSKVDIEYLEGLRNRSLRVIERMKRKFSFTTFALSIKIVLVFLSRTVQAHFWSKEIHAISSYMYKGIHVRDCYNLNVKRNLKMRKEILYYYFFLTNSN